MKKTFSLCVKFRGKKSFSCLGAMLLPSEEAAAAASAAARDNETWPPPRRWRRRRPPHRTFALCVASLLLFLPSFCNAIQDFGPHGLTAYGEPCSDRCARRGFPYTWCHKPPSRSGTWIDRDYCSAAPGVTRYQEPCVSPCEMGRNGPFYSCGTRPTLRGNWDYCSPHSPDRSVFLPFQMSQDFF